MARFLGMFFLMAIGGCVSQSQRVPGQCESALVPPAEVVQAEIVLVGEIHGTNEAPRFVGDLACALLARGRTVTIGLEMPRDMGANLRAYLVSDGGQEARNALLSTTPWNRDVKRQDGRGSRAMLELVERMRLARRAGAKVEVAAFDRASTVQMTRELAAAHEPMLAEGAEALHRPGESLLLLAGNVHAIKYAADSPFPAVGKMASLMTVHPPLTLGLRDRGGEYWACVRSGCGVQSSARSHYTDPALDGRIVLEKSGGYDGAAYIGPITASRPAIAPD